MKKIIVNLLCAFIPSKQKRKKLRQSLLSQNTVRHFEEQFYSKYMREETQPRPFELYPGNELYHYFLNNKALDIHKWHHYFPIYYKHFARYQGKPVNILELGVSNGGSLKMWKAFFGKDAKVFGVDIDESCKRFENPDEGIHIFIGDQGDRCFLESLMEKLPEIDICIDDGGHTTFQQINTFLVCYEKIHKNGVYLCEDLHTNYWESFIDSKETFINFAKRHIDYLTTWYFEEKDPTANKVPLFTGITHCISFYNSIIVFEKEEAIQPFSEQR